jgi:hypothetical protein
MEESKILKLIAGGENETVDFKRELELSKLTPIVKTTKWEI